MADLSRKCFVISPIGPEGSIIRRHANEVFDHLIVPAMNECGLQAMRSDHLSTPGKISDQVFEHILNDDLCIAVLTGHNPNVFYELAIAHARHRPVIVMSEKGAELPFDVRDLRCVHYDLWPSEIKAGTYVKALVEQLEDIKSSDWKVPPISTALAQPRDSGQAEATSPLYTIIGISDLIPEESSVYQSFGYEVVENRNPLANLWSDPCQTTDYIRAVLHDRDGEKALRVDFTSSEGFPPTVGVHPYGLIARTVPANCNYLAFKAALAESCDSEKLVLGVRVANVQVEHWKYSNGWIDGGFYQFHLDHDFKKWHYIDLSAPDLWKDFPGAGRRVPPGTRPNFKTICSVVFHFGSATSVADLGPGKGTVDLGEIRFVPKSDLVKT